MKSVGLDTEGTLDTLRQRMSRYVDEHPDEYRASANIATPAVSPTKPGLPLTHTVPAPLLRLPRLTLNYAIPAALGDYDLPPAKTMSQTRKLGVQFDDKDPWGFLEQVEELRVGYGFSDHQLLLRLPELLKGDALLWLRNLRENWNDWADFLADFKTTYFLPRYRS